MSARRVGTPAGAHQLCLSHKVIGGFRSAWGAEASAIRTSILATIRKQGYKLFDAFLAIAGPSPRQAIPACS